LELLRLIVIPAEQQLAAAAGRSARSRNRVLASLWKELSFTSGSLSPLVLILADWKAFCASHQYRPINIRVRYSKHAKEQQQQQLNP